MNIKILVCQIIGPAAAGSPGPVPTPVNDKKLSYHRGTARCVVSVEICQLCNCANSAETTCTTSPEQIEVMKLEGYTGPLCNQQ